MAKTTAAAVTWAATPGTPVSPSEEERAIERDAREHDVLRQMAEGRSNSAIASQLTVSERAVEKHISNIFSKLGLPPSDTDHRRALAVLASLES